MNTTDSKNAGKNYNKLTTDTMQEITTASEQHIPLTQVPCYQKYKNAALRRQMRAYYDYKKRNASLIEYTIGNTEDKTHKFQKILEKATILGASFI